MSWAGVIALSLGAYAFKSAGVAFGARVGPDAASRWSLEIIVVPVLAALIAVGTLDGGEQLVLDARLPALLVAAVLVWRRAPFLAAVIAAGLTAALLRLLSLG